MPSPSMSKSGSVRPESVGEHEEIIDVNEIVSVRSRESTVLGDSMMSMMTGTTSRCGRRLANVSAASRVWKCSARLERSPNSPITRNFRLRRLTLPPAPFDTEAGEFEPAFTVSTRLRIEKPTRAAVEHPAQLQNLLVPRQQRIVARVSRSPGGSLSATSTSISLPSMLALSTPSACL